MNAEFAQIDYEISNCRRWAPATPTRTARAVHTQYVATTRKYADDLGDNEVKRRLATEAQQLAPWCPSCVGILRQELESY